MKLVKSLIVGAAMGLAASGFAVAQDKGLVGVSSCLGCDCFVIAVAEPDAPPGLLKARLQALAVHVQEAFSAVS